MLFSLSCQRSLSCSLSYTTLNLTTYNFKHFIKLQESSKMLKNGNAATKDQSQRKCWSHFMLYKETSNKLVSIERLIIEQKASCNLLTSLQNLLVSSDPLGRGVLLSSVILSSPSRPCEPITLSPLHPNQWSNSGPGPKYQITSI